MIQELLGGTAMDQLKGTGPANPPSLPLVLQPIASNPSPTSSSTSSRSSAQQTQRSSSATSSPQHQVAVTAAGQQQEQTPLRCPRCNSSNTKFCYYNNYNLTQPRHFCKTCRRYWTKGGALRNVPIGGGCRKPRPVPAPVAKPVAPCKAVGAAPCAAPPLGLGVGASPWASAPQATAQLMALLNSARGAQGHGSNVHRLLGLDTMGHLQILPGTANAAAAAAQLWPQATPRQMPPPPHMDSQLGMGPVGHHDVLSSLGLKPPSSSPTSAAASYYSDQLHAVVSNVGRQHVYDVPVSLPCTTAVASIPGASATVSSAGSTVGLESAVSLASPEMQYWSGPAMSVAWPDLPTPNGGFP